MPWRYGIDRLAHGARDPHPRGYSWLRSWVRITACVAHVRAKFPWISAATVMCGRWRPSPTSGTDLAVRAHRHGDAQLGLRQT